MKIEHQQTVTLEKSKEIDFLHIKVTDKTIIIETMVEFKKIQLNQDTTLNLILDEKSKYTKTSLIFDGKYRLNIVIINLNTNRFRFRTYKHNQIIHLDNFNIKEISNGVTEMPYELCLSNGKIEKSCLISCKEESHEMTVMNCFINELMCNVKSLELFDSHVKTLYNGNVHAHVKSADYSRIGTSNIPHIPCLEYFDNNRKPILEFLLNSEEAIKYLTNHSI